MDRRLRIYSAVIVVIIVAAAVIWYFYPRPVAYRIDFEQGFGEWTPDADVPLDPNNPSHPVAWNVTRVVSPAHSGQYSVELYIDGRQDDGTVWIEKRIPVESDSQIRVEVAFEFYSEQESFNVIASVCAFVGVSPPEAEGDFTVIGNANEVAGWKRYTHSATLHTDSEGQAWVAVGLTVRWETEMTYNVDDVEIRVA
jgi:hypothetical protein